jgi:hypothetical protein
MNLFGLSYEQCYGPDSWKNSPTKHRWENMPSLEILNNPKKRGPMTAREFMQHFGTEVMRKIYSDVWISNCMKRIDHDRSPVAIISDCRFINEIEAVKAAGGKVIRLTRAPIKSSHSSENETDDYKNFDGIIDNKNMTIEESCEAFLEMMVDMGVTRHLRTINPRLGTMTIK